MCISSQFFFPLPNCLLCCTKFPPQSNLCVTQLYATIFAYFSRVQIFEDVYALDCHIWKRHFSNEQQAVHTAEIWLYIRIGLSASRRACLVFRH